MALSEIRSARLGLVLSLLVSPAAAQKASDLTAVLTQVEGQVTLSKEARGAFPLLRPAAQLQVIQKGETIHVLAGAWVNLICSTETLVSLEGPTDWVLNAEACARGTTLPESSYASMAPRAGRLLPKNGALLLEFDTRTGDQNPLVLLHPRKTALREPRPLFVWTRVPDAFEYEIQLRGAVAVSIHVPAATVPCGPGAGPWHDLDVCTWTPSTQWPSLEPENPVSFKLGYRKTSIDSLRLVREVYTVHFLSDNDRKAVDERLRKINASDLDDASRLLLSAGIYAQSGLGSDAITAYDAALRVREVAEARVALGDLYLSLGLTDLAEREYRKVVAEASASPAEPAAELGLGQSAYRRKSFDEAEAHFLRAHALYAALDLAAEAAEAQAAATRVQAEGGSSP
jgi:hypothetical protein